MSFLCPTWDPSHFQNISPCHLQSWLMCPIQGFFQNPFKSTISDICDFSYQIHSRSHDPKISILSSSMAFIGKISVRAVFNFYKIASLECAFQYVKHLHKNGLKLYQDVFANIQIFLFLKWNASIQNLSAMPMFQKLAFWNVFSQHFTVIEMQTLNSENVMNDKMSI